MIINEFSYSLYNKHINMSFYWLYWLIEWDKINVKKNGKYVCSYRKKYTKIDKYSTDSVWLIWETIINITNKNNNSYLKKNIESLVNLYIYNFKPTQKNKKIPII